MANQNDDFKRLRRQAQKKINKEPPANLSNLSTDDALELIEELRLHRIELQLQNEELQENRQALEISRTLYRDLYDFAPVGYFTLDRDGVILAVNLTGTGLLGTTRQALEKRRFAGYIAPESQDIFFQHRRQLLKTGRRQVSELELVRQDGSRFYGQLESVMMEDKAHDAVRIQMVLSDITARKQVEAQLEQYRSHLEELVAARTNELLIANQILQAEIGERKQAEARLQQSNERLEQALAELKAAQQRVVQQERLAAVGQLAAGIAHDFNNILTGIIGHAELIMIQPKLTGTTAEESARTVVKNGERAAHLIRQILDFSRKSIRRPELIELRTFVQETAAFLQRTIPENIHIQLELEPGEFKVKADPAQLQQVLTNLAVNARDAMVTEGTLTLQLTSITLKPGDFPPAPEMPAGPWLVLAVSDTGGGIPAEVLPHIFEPFFTTKTVGQGTGLGLAQVYGIIKQHEGYIDVASVPGEGTTFRICLPPFTGGVRETAPVKLAALPKGQGECILVVEDEPTVLRLMQAILTALNYQVLTAANGRAGLAVYQEKKDEIALVISDMVMPKLDGPGLLQALRQEDPQIKVIMMSGYPLGKEIDQPSIQDIKGWLQKPLTLKRVAQVVRLALE